MSILAEKKLRNWFLFALVLQVIAAWFSLGYHNLDEHFSLLELCNYKCGLSPVGNLSWEYAYMLRSAFLTLIAVVVSKFFLAIHLYNPFVVALVLRLMAGILAWWATCRLVVQFLPAFKTDIGRKFFIFTSLFLWYLAYVGVRFQSENISGSFFLLAASLLLKEGEETDSKRNLRLLAVGFLFGFVLFIRLQFAFGLLGAAVWILFVKKMPFKQWLLIVVGALVASGANVVIDYWFYGKWVFTLYNYFDTQIIMDLASNYGKSPWWYFFKEYATLGIAPMSVILIFLYLDGIRRSPRNFFVLVSIVFLLFHSVIGHKELRFVFPMMFTFTYVACISFDKWFETFTYKPVLNIVAIVLLGINVVGYCYKTFSPANENVVIYKYLYDHAVARPITVYCAGSSLYLVGDLNVDFYKSKNVQVEVEKTNDDLVNALSKDKSDETYLVARTRDFGKKLQPLKVELIDFVSPRSILHKIRHMPDDKDAWFLFKISKN